MKGVATGILHSVTLGFLNPSLEDGLTALSSQVAEVKMGADDRATKHVEVVCRNLKTVSTSPTTWLGLFIRRNGGGKQNEARTAHPGDDLLASPEN